MKLLIILLIVSVVSVMGDGSGGKYTSRYDNFNIGELLSNKRLLEAYLKCLLDIGNCSPEGKELKSHIQEALEDNCERCTDVQRSNMQRVLTHLVNHEKEYWNKLTAKYDPKRKYVIRYEKELREITG